MRTKLYFSPDIQDECFCHSIDYLLQEMKENKLQAITVFQAVKDNDKSHFYCKKHDTVGEKGSCGIDCSSYIPRNGKNGICKYYGFCYEKGEKFVLYENGELVEFELSKNRHYTGLSFCTCNNPKAQRCLLTGVLFCMKCLSPIKI